MKQTEWFKPDISRNYHLSWKKSTIAVGWIFFLSLGDFNVFIVFDFCYFQLKKCYQSCKNLFSPRQSLIHPRPEGKKKILFVRLYIFFIFLCSIAWKNSTYFTETLLKKIGLREKSKVIDLSRKSLTVERLTESKLMCSVQDKVQSWSTDLCYVCQS